MGDLKAAAAAGVDAAVTELTEGALVALTIVVNDAMNVGMVLDIAELPDGTDALDPQAIVKLLVGAAQQVANDHSPIGGQG